MGKKGGAKNPPKSESKSHPITLREEATGKLKTKPIVNTKSHLRIDHLKKLAVWTSTDPPIPSLAAFYGQHLATVSEAAGVPPDPSFLTCQRCETVVHPGFNSTVRIEKNRSKVRHKQKNNVVYKCHFCSHQTIKRGTPKGHLKKICPAPATKPILHEPFKLEKYMVRKDKGCEILAVEVAPMKGLETPVSTGTPTLLEAKKTSRNNSASKNTFETPSMSARVEAVKTQSTASKRRKKSWTSLKEIAQSKERDNSRVANLTIPFFL